MPNYFKQAASSAWSGAWYDAAAGGNLYNGAIALPQDGDTVYLNNKIVTLDVDTNAVAAIYPGVAANNTGSGSITCAVDALTIRATTMLAGTVSLIISSLATPKTLTIIGNVTAGTGASTHGISNSSTGTINITGDVIGGSGGASYGINNPSTGEIIFTGNAIGGSVVNCHGIYNATTGLITVTGNIIGGGYRTAYGLFNVTTGAVTLINCSMINTTQAVAYIGTPPTTWSPRTQDYIQWGDIKFPAQLLASQVLAGVVHGDIAGTLASPAAPSVSIATGTNSVTLTIAGDAGVTNYVKYKAPGDSGWSDGGSRSGDGDVTVSGLSNAVNYYFIVYSQNAAGLVSSPSVVFAVLFTVSADNEHDTELIASASDFVNTFGEDVIYKPRGGGSRSIKAVITRKPPEVIDGAPHGTAPKIEIDVVNSATTGIGSSEVDRGGDMVTIQRLIGETASDRAIVKIISQDFGMMKLEVN